MKSIVVYCGSSRGSNLYVSAAEELAKSLVEEEVTLIYGGGRVGLMGVLADKVMRLGGRVVGVIPEFLNIKEIQNQDITEVHVVKTMHERKQKMADLSDAAIALPGGFGTLEELLEYVTWTQLRIHNKPCGLLNIQGYFNLLQAFLGHTVDEGFVHPDHQRILLSDDQPKRLISGLRNWVATHGDITAYKLV